MALSPLENPNVILILKANFYKERLLSRFESMQQTAADFDRPIPAFRLHLITILYFDTNAHQKTAYSYKYKRKLQRKVEVNQNMKGQRGILLMFCNNLLPQTEVSSSTVGLDRSSFSNRLMKF